MPPFPSLLQEISSTINVTVHFKNQETTEAICQ